MTRDKDPGIPEDGTEQDTPAGRPRSIASDQDFSRFFEESFEATVAWTLKNFKKIVRGQARAEDVVMDAFEALYKDRLSLEDRDPVPCLQRRVRTLLLDQQRHDDAKENYLASGASKTLTASSVRPADSILASRECRELFSEEAIGSLNAEDRRVFDLYLQEKSYQEMAESLGGSWESARWQLRMVIFKLFQAMARLMTLANPHQLSAPADAVVLRNPEHARKAIANSLPRLLSQAVRLVHVEGVPPAQVVIRLRLSSTDELAMHLKRAYHVLELLYKAKMPETLIAALNYKDPRSKPPRE